jgi:class 3 adenylate cyclase
MEQQIRYCKTSDGVRIAYGTYGNEGMPPLVDLCVPPWQEALWATPWGRLCFEALARTHRLITIDPRGTGASQRDVETITLESGVHDLLAVVDHLRIRQFALLSQYPYQAPALTFAARYVERVVRLALWSPRVTQQGRPDIGESAHANWGMYTRAAATLFFPTGPAEAQRLYSNAFRSGTTPDAVASVFDWTYDLTPLLPELTMPALVLYRKHAQGIEAEQARTAASVMPNAQLMAIDGDIGIPYFDHQRFVRVLEEFLGVETRPETQGASGTAVILFTDIVASTALTERMGDARFRDASRALDAGLRAAIREAGGAAIDGKLLGDGVLATFPSAAQAIDGARRCLALTGSSNVQRQTSNIQIRIGLHAGDVIREDNNVYGGAVNIASRICGLSSPGEILVSDVVRGMARSSAGVEFEDRGEQEMKGVGEPVRVYAVRGGGES